MGSMEVVFLKRKPWKLALLCVAVPLAVGGLSGWLTRGSMARFAALNKPPLSPPGWVFPVVWTVLFILMGLASYLVLTSGRPEGEVAGALGAYGAQLAVNFFWSLFFFNLSRYLFAFFWLVLLWALVFVTLRRFGRLSRTAGRLLIPYLAWVTFAGYLNFGVWLLN